ncbi:MAG: hypothetical protein ACRDRL_14350 [Sciscionella sp.]
MCKSTPPSPAAVMPPPEQPPLQVVLTCGRTECRHTFEPDPIAFTISRLTCPECGGWIFQAELAEPPSQGGDR